MYFPVSDNTSHTSSLADSCSRVLALDIRARLADSMHAAVCFKSKLLPSRLVSKAAPLVSCFAKLLMRGYGRLFDVRKASNWSISGPESKSRRLRSRISPHLPGSSKYHPISESSYPFQPISKLSARLFPGHLVCRSRNPNSPKSHVSTSSSGRSILGPLSH